MPDAPTAARYTHDFVRKYLPPHARSVLEIGCGTGKLASRLVEYGLKVVALDSDGDCAAEGKARGVDALAASWRGAERPGPGCDAGEARHRRAAAQAPFVD